MSDKAEDKEKKSALERHFTAGVATLCLAGIVWVLTNSLNHSVEMAGIKRDIASIKRDNARMEMQVERLRAGVVNRYDSKDAAADRQAMERRFERLENAVFMPRPKVGK